MSKPRASLVLQPCAPRKPLWLNSVGGNRRGRRPLRARTGIDRSVVPLDQLVENGGGQEARPHR